jgi:radical SAM protein with 4Fe4S-binding SPASM domain
MDSVYSTEKTLYHPRQMEALRKGEQPYPVHVELIISDYCNHDCSFCAYRMSGYTSNELFQIEEGQSRKARNPKRMIPKEKCFEILDDCKAMGVKAIQFTGGGEPTVHPDFVDIVEYAQSLGFDTALVTNGNMLVEERHRRVLKKMTWVRVSIDAAKPQTYMEMRGVGYGAWRRLVDGVDMFNQDIKDLEDRPVFGAGFVTTPENWTEMYDAAWLYRSWGFDNIRIGLMFNPDNDNPYKQIRYKMNYLALKAIEDFDGNGDFRVINRVSEKLGELTQGSPDFDFCSYQHFTTYIGGDLNVYRCCVYAYHHHGIVGSIKEQGFKELWDSQAKKENMDSFNPRECERCQFTEIINNTNRSIESKEPLGGVPPHVNFT